MLSEFLLTNQEDILALTEKKTLELAGIHQSSTQLKEGLPDFFRQMIGVINNADKPESPPAKDVDAIAEAADRCDEPAMAAAAGHPEEAALAKTAGLHGAELLRLGYTLSHVVHAYGAMCQAITEIASTENIPINASEFHALNRCLDVAIAGAVTEYQALQDSLTKEQEDKPAGFSTLEMRNALNSAIIAFQSIKKGTVGIGGSTGQILENSLKRIENLMYQQASGQGL